MAGISNLSGFSVVPLNDSDTHHAPVEMPNVIMSSSITTIEEEDEGEHPNHDLNMSGLSTEGLLPQLSPPSSQSVALKMTSSSSSSSASSHQSRPRCPSGRKDRTSISSDAGLFCRRCSVSGSSFHSTFSDGKFCRICHEGDWQEELISPCRCSGTMGLMHRTCVEKWLGSSNTNKCEICHYEYKTERINRPFFEWIRSPASPQDRKNVIADMVCFLLLTPLAFVSAWLCISGALHYDDEEDKDEDSHWQATGLISLTIFLFMIYVVWCSVAVRYHCKVWSEWRNSQQRVTVVGRESVTDANNNDSTTSRSVDRHHHSDTTFNTTQESVFDSPPSRSVTRHTIPSRSCLLTVVSEVEPMTATILPESVSRGSQTGASADPNDLQRESCF